MLLPTLLPSHWEKQKVYLRVPLSQLALASLVVRRAGARDSHHSGMPFSRYNLWEAKHTGGTNGCLYYVWSLGEGEGH